MKETPHILAGPLLAEIERLEKEERLLRAQEAAGYLLIHEWLETLPDAHKEWAEAYLMGQ